MRRILSTLLLLLLGLGPMWAAVPAEAFASGLLSGLSGKIDESHLPACCRRNGIHHCAMHSRQAANRETAISAANCCPCAPQALASTAAPMVALVREPGSLAFPGSRLSAHDKHVSAVPSEQRSWPKRGPPAIEIA